MYSRSILVLHLPPSPPPPKLPPLLITLPPSIPPPDPQEINWHPGRNERHNNNRLKWLREDSSAQQEQADAAEDDRSTEPSPVRSFKVRLSYAQHDESEYSQ